MTVIRTPRPDDVPALVALVDALNIHEGEPRGAFNEAMAHRDVLAPNCPLKCVVAEQDGALVGYAFWHFSYETAYAARGSFVADLFVSEGHYGQSLGQQLLTDVARRTKADGGEYLWLTAYRTNNRARAFYRKVMSLEEDDVVNYSLIEERFQDMASGHVPKEPAP